jgi:hypothetical protein
MAELIYLVVLPSIAVGIAYLVFVAAAAWVGFRLFGYLPKGYEDRLISAQSLLLDDARRIIADIRGTSEPAAVSLRKAELHQALQKYLSLEEARGRTRNAMSTAEELGKFHSDMCLVAAELAKIVAEPRQ